MFNIENSSDGTDFDRYRSTALSRLMEGEDLEPGSAAGYDLCKLIYLYHPLGGKMVDRPIKMAMNESRTVHVPGPLEQQLRDAFEREWKLLKADEIIANTGRQARIYGVGAVAMIVNGGDADPNTTVDFQTLADQTLTFNVLDPMNTAGSIVLNQDPNSPEFQKVTGITVGGKSYNASRVCVVMNEEPIYLAYNSASFGFSGRSVYQRALYPLKSFIQTMRTDDMVAVKGGLLIAKIKQASSVINKMMQGLSAIKRMMLKRGGTGDILQIGDEDSVESIDLKNLEGPLESSRNHIIGNIAAAADMPAILLNSETFTRGFGEGTEDAKAVAVYVDDIRKWLEPLYQFFIRICQYRAWNKTFFDNLKNDIPEITGSWDTNFTGWLKEFSFVWAPSLKEAASEKVKVDDIRFKALVSMGETLLPQFKDDPVNRAALIMWIAENANMNENLFATRLELDEEAVKLNPPKGMEGTTFEQGDL